VAITGPVSSGYFVSVLLGNVLALTVLIFGVVALYAYLADGAQRTLALGAMASSIVGISLMLSRLGVFAYAVPVLSRSFFDGNQESIRILDRIFAGPLGTVEIASALLYLAGFRPLRHLAVVRLARVGGGPYGGPRPADLRAVPGGGFAGGGVAGACRRRVDRPQRLTRHSRPGSRPDASCPVISRDVRTLRAQGSLPLGSTFRWMRIHPVSLYHREGNPVEGEPYVN
jgi:hypothetical protein